MGVVLLTAVAPAAFGETDPLIEGARQCTQYFPQQERSNNIPTHLLAAIATTESGRHHDRLNMNIPWPWTINVEGKGYFFASKAEAIANTQNFLAKGYESIDVGCMQVNLKHHPKAFANLNEAFDPAKNVAYAAKFLRNNYATSGDWIKATAAYHSRTPQFGERYLAQIEKSWNQIVGKVAAARAGKAEGGAQIADASNKSLPSVKTAKQKPFVRARLTEQASEMPNRTGLHSPLVIQVADAPRQHDSEVQVVHPSAVQPQTVHVADASVPPTASAIPAGSTIRRVKLDNSQSSSDSGRVSPYVFTN